MIEVVADNCCFLFNFPIVNLQTKFENFKTQKSITLKNIPIPPPIKFE